jgi:2-polyprenyl-3-methyl-5-hydroxy-6-metoxy-1,4-benzoquinol methylase
MPKERTIDNTLQRKIEYLSPPAEVSMGDRWFEISSVEHFWFRRRFDVLQKLAGDLISSGVEMAEIGCGHGLLQRQVEDQYGREVAGFDLNEYALKQNISRRSPVVCYDIYKMDASLRSRFGIIFLFDVLEHITDEDGFLQALLFHLADKGTLVVNVPAGQWAYSEYDRAVGHVRRYSIATMRATAERSGLRIREWTYWGLPLLPTLAVRNLWIMGKRNNDEVISSGFDSRSTAVNNLLRLISRCEVVPQKVSGTSLMAILERSK